MKYFFLSVALFVSAIRAHAEQAILGKAEEESFAGKVVRIDVGEDDLINGQSFKFWERILKRVEEEKAAAVVFHLDTPGGLAFPTKELMSQIANLEIPTYSFIDPQAMSDLHGTGSLGWFCCSREWKWYGDRRYHEGEDRKFFRRACKMDLREEGASLRGDRGHDDDSRRGATGRFPCHREGTHQPGHQAAG